ncbi:hypothetical protein Bca4012_042860 [Brassica carinata]
MISATEKPQEVIISQSVRERNCEDRISALPDDLLVKILLFVPTKYIVTTMILSKRWRTIWTEVPRLEYEDIVSNTNSEQKSVWWFLEKSLQLHKAPILESLCIQLKEICPTNVDVAKLVAQAVDRSLRRLLFHLSWLAKPTSMPNRLYTCETLTELELFNKIILDVPPSVCLPSLAKLFLFCVVYKDDVSLFRLLSNCPVLRILLVIRSEEDGNVKKYTVKVPSLEEFTYLYKRPLSLAENTRSLVLDCPALTKLSINDHSGDSCSIGNMPSITPHSDSSDSSVLSPHRDSSYSSVLSPNRDSSDLSPLEDGSKPTTIDYSLGAHRICSVGSRLLRVKNGSLSSGHEVLRLKS